MTAAGHNVSCRDVEERFDALLEGRLEPAARASVEAHLAGCPRCHDLAEVAGVLAVARPDEAPDLTSAVLARTVGDACDRARVLLCERMDGSIPEVDQELVQGHVDRCASCRRSERVLDAMAQPLRESAWVQPDRRFVRDVMRATLGPDARWGLLAARLSRGWTRLVTRPRFGLEASYVGAMLLFALFALPASPLHGAAERLLEVTGRGSTAVAEASTAVGEVPGQVARLGDKAWNATGAHGVASLRDTRRDLNQRYDRTRPARQSLRLHGRRLRDAARDGDLPASREVLQEIGTDIGQFVRLISDTEDSDHDQPRESPPPGAGRG